MNLAIFSPNQNPYSETFIQAHKNHIKANKLYYIFGKSLFSLKIDNNNNLSNLKFSLKDKLKKKLFKLSDTTIIHQKLANTLKELNIDVVLIEYGTHAMKLLPILEKSRIPFVVHFHGSDASVKFVIEKNNRYKHLIELAHAIVVVSTVMYQKLIELGCPEDKLVYNVYGANPIFKERQAKFSKKQAIAIGRFVDKKAPYYTILAFKKVLEKHPDAKLLMAGEGELWPTCNNLIKHFNLENNIDLLGVVTPEKVSELMQESYCFVQHSITAESGDQEGTPLAVLESALSGLPVVSTYHAGIPDVIKHKKTGLLCEEHDIDQMAINLIRIFDDAEYAKKLGLAAREDHIKNFSLDRHINSLEKTLKKVIRK